MQKRYFQTLALALILFATWTYMRNTIWDNPDLYPDEVIMIYARDSDSFFIALRFIFVALWGWGAYLLWKTGMSIYAWFAVVIYAAFLIVDNFVLATHYLQFKAVNEPWEAAFPMSIFRGIPEAILTILFNVLAVWMLKNGLEKRRQLEAVDLTINVHA